MDLLNDSFLPTKVKPRPLKCNARTSLFREKQHLRPEKNTNDTRPPHRHATSILRPDKRHARPEQQPSSVRTRATLHADKNRVPCGQAGNAFPGVYQAVQVTMRQHPNAQASPNRPRVNRKKRKKKRGNLFANSNKCSIFAPANEK